MHISISPKNTSSPPLPFLQEFHCAFSISICPRKPFDETIFRRNTPTMTKKKQGATPSGLGSLSLGHLREPRLGSFSSDEEEGQVEARRKKPRLGEEEKMGDLETTMYLNVWAETSFLLNMIEFHTVKNVYPFSSPEAMDEFVRYWTRPIDLPHPSQFITQKIKYAEKSYEEREKRHHLQGETLISEEVLAHHLGEHIWGSKFKKDDDAIGVGDEVGHVGVGDEEEGQQVGLEQKDLTKYPNLIKGLNKIPSDYHAIRDEAIVLMEESELEELDKKWEQLQKEKAELNEKQQGMITELLSPMQNAINSKTQDQ